MHSPPEKVLKKTATGQVGTDAQPRNTEEDVDDIVIVEDDDEVDYRLRRGMERPVKEVFHTSGHRKSTKSTAKKKQKQNNRSSANANKNPGTVKHVLQTVSLVLPVLGNVRIKKPTSAKDEMRQSPT